MRRWVVAWGPAAAWAAVLFLVSSRPTLPVPLSSGIDKLAHFGAYLVLGLLLAHGVRRLALHPLVAVSLGSGYGILDEVHQRFVPGRDASVGDWVADAAGAVVGVLLFHFLSGRREITPGGPSAKTVSRTS